MATSPETVQTLLQQLYENESLTNALTDDAAKALLEWGESQLNSVAAYDNKEAELEQMARRLHRVMRAVNRAIELKSTLTDDQMVLRLLTLVESSMDLGVLKSTAQSTTSTGEAQHG
jgi:Tfp pilus assembly protein PilX